MDIFRQENFHQLQKPVLAKDFMLKTICFIGEGLSSSQVTEFGKLIAI